MNNYFAENIKYLREKYNLLQEDLAKIIGVEFGTISHWENKRREPKMEYVFKIANYFNVNDEIITVDLRKKDMLIHNNKIVNGLKIPVLGRIPAGIPIEAIEDILGWEDIPNSWITGGREYFALKIQGDSMEPNYSSGDVVIFQKTNDCESGKHCAVMVNGDDATFKKVIKQEQGILLYPINDKYEAIFYTNEDIEKLPIRILGIAKEIRRKID